MASGIAHLLVSNPLYSEIQANLSYGYFLKPDRPDKGGSTIAISKHALTYIQRSAVQLNLGEQGAPSGT